MPETAETRDAYRLFIAIPLPEPVKASILRVQGELRATLPGPSIRWTRPEQFHLTLRFLGNTASQQIEALQHSLRTACSRFGSLHLHVIGVGAFPNLRRPRVVWTHVHDAGDRLARLQRAVEDAAAPFTSEEAERTFTGHVTLARCRSITGAETNTIAVHAAALKTRSFGEWTADAIQIVRSQLGPAGSRYTTMAVIPLQD